MKSITKMICAILLLLVVVATHWSAGTAHTGTGKILYSGTVTPNISISQNVTPQLTTASTVTEG